jgi:hypothetical protein
MSNKTNKTPNLKSATLAAAAVLWARQMWEEYVQAHEASEEVLQRITAAAAKLPIVKQLRTFGYDGNVDCKYRSWRNSAELSITISARKSKDSSVTLDIGTNIMPASLSSLYAQYCEAYGKEEKLQDKIGSFVRQYSGRHIGMYGTPERGCVPEQLMDAARKALVKQQALEKSEAVLALVNDPETSKLLKKALEAGEAAAPLTCDK